MESEISVFVRSMDERKEELKIKPSDSIGNFRTKVHDIFRIFMKCILQLDIEQNEIYLLFRGRKLEDNQTIASCNISDGDTVLLVKKMTPQQSR